MWPHAYHRAVVETSPDAMPIIDEVRRIQSCDPSIERMVSDPAADIVGRRMGLILAADQPLNAQAGGLRRTSLEDRGLRGAMASNIAEWQALIIVEDNGIGFDVDGPSPTAIQGCLGLLGMRERMSHGGGTLTIESAPGRGTSVFISLAK